VAHERRRLRDGLKRARVAVRVTFVPEATTGAVGMELGRRVDVIHFPGTERTTAVWFWKTAGVAHFLSKEIRRGFFPPSSRRSSCCPRAFRKRLGTR
jgi:hypothetical protein